MSNIDYRDLRTKQSDLDIAINDIMTGKVERADRIPEYYFDIVDEQEDHPDEAFMFDESDDPDSDVNLSAFRVRMLCYKLSECSITNYAMRFLLNVVEKSEGLDDMADVWFTREQYDWLMNLKHIYGAPQ